MLDKNGDYIYPNPDSNETLSHTISTHIITLRGSIVAHITVSDHCLIQATQSHDIAARRTFVSHDCHRQVTVDSLAELWYIDQKRAQATIDATL